MAATAPTTDGSITPVRDNTRCTEKSATPSFANKITGENPAGHSNGLAIGFVFAFSLDHKRPVTEVVYSEGYCDTRKVYEAAEIVLRFVDLITIRRAPNAFGKGFVAAASLLCVLHVGR